MHYFRLLAILHPTNRLTAHIYSVNYVAFEL